MQWFLAVHASIPFIAMLRKAVIMPKIAIACTIACAIAGQAMGARMERDRLSKAATAEGPLIGSGSSESTARQDLARLQRGAQKGKGRKVAIVGRVDATEGMAERSRDAHLTSAEAQQADFTDWQMDSPLSMGSFKQLLGMPYDSVIGVH